MKRALLYLSILVGVVAAVPRLSGQGKSQYVVELKNGQSMAGLAAEYGVASVRQIPGRSIYLVEGAADNGQTLKKLKQNGGVESAEVNAPAKLDDSAETLYLLDTKSSALLNGIVVPAIYAGQPALSIIKADQTRGISTGAATRVGLIDTGVDFTHPALGPWLDPGADLINGRSASEFDGLSLQGAETLYLLDDSAETLYLLDHGFGRAASGVPPAFGHGTLVAGVVHAVAPDAVIVPLKVFDAYGNATLFNIIDAVYRAAELRVDVLNMSFSGNLESTALRTAINQVRSLGMTVVSSVGNQGANAGDVFPAAYTGVYGVAATDFGDRLASFSNFGKSVSIAAPGAFLISTAPGGRYAAVWGTSFSSPLVSGTIALLASLTTPGHSEGPRVLTTADFIDDINPGFEKQLGKGRLNALRALQQGR